MKTKKLKILSIIFALGIFTLASCEKPDPDSQSAEDDARGSYIMADAFAVSNNEAGDDGTGKGTYPAGMTVTRDSVNQTMTITFDNSEFRGKIRNGIIHISYERLINIGPRAVNLTITFENYTIDGIKVEGTISTSFGGTYTTPEISVTATNMKATFPDNKFIAWSSEMTYKIVEGFGDYDIDNNVLEISGTVNGTNRAGEEYTSVWNKVTLKRSCPDQYPVSGTVTITSDKGETVIDYGNGECDNVISVSNNGATVTITLD